MNANTRTPPSLRRVYIALAWSPKVVELCIVDLSMSELSGFADVFSGGPVAITFPGLPLIWPSTYFILPTHPLHIDQFISYIGSRSGGGPLRGLATGFPIGPSPKSLDSHII